MARSNRQLTQFAVDKIKHCIRNGVTSGTFTAGNTEVRVMPHLIGETLYSVRLFDEEILSVSFGDGHHPTIYLYTGDFYDSKGRPSRTTRERLNGLLDFLSSERMLPEGVRVFIREDGRCCLGKGADHYIFDASNPRWIISAKPARVLGLEPLISPLLTKQIPESIIAKGLL